MFLECTLLAVAAWLPSARCVRPLPVTTFCVRLVDAPDLLILAPHACAGAARRALFELADAGKASEEEVERLREAWKKRGEWLCGDDMFNKWLWATLWGIRFETVGMGIRTAPCTAL